MSPESAKQFLMDLALIRSQPEDRISAFREWQRQARPEELASLDQWHEEWLLQQRQDLDIDNAMLDRNGDWLEQRVLELVHEQDRTLPGRNPVKYLLRWAAAAAVIGAIATGAWFSLHRQGAYVGTAIPPEGLTAGAVLTLSDGQQVSLAQIPIGATIPDGDLRIVKLDSTTLSYERGPAHKKTGSNKLTIVKGEVYHVVLPDGSQVWLNSCGTLTYPATFAGANRTVELTGEAYFDIQRNPRAPFMVRAPVMDVQVLGTSFNIMAYADESSVRVTLVDGALAVSRGEGRKVLAPGDQAMASTGIGDTVAIAGAISVARANMEEVLAWRRGEFRFKKASIQRVMRQMARWYNLTVDYSGPVPTAPFSGVMTRNTALPQLLKALEISGGVHFIVRGNNITVLAAPR